MSAHEIYCMDCADGIVKSYHLRKARYESNFVAFSRDHPYWGRELSIAARLAGKTDNG